MPTLPRREVKNRTKSSLVGVLKRCRMYKGNINIVRLLGTSERFTDQNVVTTYNTVKIKITHHVRMRWSTKMSGNF